MKAFAIDNRFIKSARSVSRARVSRARSGAVLLMLLLASCTVAETSPSAPSNAEVPLPPVSLPSLRLPGQSTAINSLSADRAEEKVSISGNVTKRVATLGGWLYQLEDSTGSLWVKTSQSDPIVGDMATVSGIIRYEAIVVGEIDAGEVYLEEQSYRSNN